VSMPVGLAKLPRTTTDRQYFPRLRDLVKNTLEWSQEIQRAAKKSLRKQPKGAGSRRKARSARTVGR